MNQKWGMSPKGTPVSMNFPNSEQKPPTTKFEPQMVGMNHKTMMVYNQGLITDSDQRKI